MNQAKHGDSVKVNYTGKLDDGSVFDTTDNRQPLHFVLGEQQLIKGFEEAVVGMSPGESKTVKLPPEGAYGARRNELVVTIDRAHIGQDVVPQVGQRVELQQQDGSSVGATVTQVSESTVTVDANHPLAGQSLTFEISLLEVG